MTQIPDFNEPDLWTMRTLLRQDFGEEIRVRRAETGLHRNRHITEVTRCPAVRREPDDSHHIVVTGVATLPQLRADAAAGHGQQSSGCGRAGFSLPSNQ